MTKLILFHILNKFLSQIDCHDSGTESDGDLDTEEDLHDRDLELSKLKYRNKIT